MDKKTHDLCKKTIEKWILYFMDLYEINREQAVKLIKDELLKGK